MRHPFYYEVRRWSQGNKDYHSVRVKTQTRRHAMTAALVRGRDAETTVLRLLLREGFITDTKTPSLKAAAGEAGYRVVKMGDVEVLRRRELHDYGIGEI